MFCLDYYNMIKILQILKKNKLSYAAEGKIKQFLHE